MILGTGQVGGPLCNPYEARHKSLENGMKMFKANICGGNDFPPRPPRRMLCILSALEYGGIA